MMQTVFNSPAVGLLLDLENAAIESGAELSLTVMPAGRLQVGPTHLLTPERCEQIRQHRDALRLLAQVADVGVQVRVQAFRQQLSAPTDSAGYPAVRWTAAGGESGCVSCGDPNPRSSVLCWRCQTAARLARDGDLPLDWVPVGSHDVTNGAGAI